MKAEEEKAFSPKKGISEARDALEYRKYNIVQWEHKENLRRFLVDRTFSCPVI